MWLACGGSACHPKPHALAGGMVHLWLGITAAIREWARNPRCKVMPVLRVQWAVLMLTAGFNTCKDGMIQGSLKGPHCKSNNML